MRPKFIFSEKYKLAVRKTFGNSSHSIKVRITIKKEILNYH